MIPNLTFMKIGLFFLATVVAANTFASQAVVAGNHLSRISVAEKNDRYLVAEWNFSSSVPRVVEIRQTNGELVKTIALSGSKVIFSEPDTDAALILAGEFSELNTSPTYRGNIRLFDYRQEKLVATHDLSQLMSRIAERLGAEAKDLEKNAQQVILRSGTRLLVSTRSQLQNISYLGMFEINKTGFHLRTEIINRLSGQELQLTDSNSTLSDNQRYLVVENRQQTTGLAIQESLIDLQMLTAIDLDGSTVGPLQRTLAVDNSGTQFIRGPLRQTISPKETPLTVFLRSGVELKISHVLNAYTHADYSFGRFEKALFLQDGQIILSYASGQWVQGQDSQYPEFVTVIFNQQGKLVQRLRKSKLVAHLKMEELFFQGVAHPSSPDHQALFVAAVKVEDLKNLDSEDPDFRNLAPAGQVGATQVGSSKIVLFSELKANSEYPVAVIRE